MMTTPSGFHTFASWPNSRLKMPIVPGPQTSWVISTSALTHTLSPGRTSALPEARARIFSVMVIGAGMSGTLHAYALGVALAVLDLVERVQERERARHDNVGVGALPHRRRLAVADETRNLALSVGAAGDRLHGVALELAGRAGRVGDRGVAG